MNPIQRLLNAGLTRKEILEKARVDESEISRLLNGDRKASLRQRKLFYDAFGVSPWDWDENK